MGPSDIQQLARDYENEIKQIKDNMYRMGWHMRGSMTYDDLFFVLSVEDREIISRIIKDNVESTNKTGLPLV